MLFNKRFTAALLFGVLVDQITKQIALHNLSMFKPFAIIPHIFEFQLVKNFGAAYGIFQNQRFFLLMVSVAVILFCIIFQRVFEGNRARRLGVLFLLIGAIGNLIDRLYFGYVIDFINIQIFPVFNIADMAIDVGVGCFIYDVYLDWKHNQKPGKTHTSESE
ncbi:MAG: signal peptidase II [bacterium]|nr:signal peptidase II [bacterium]